MITYLYMVHITGPAEWVGQPGHAPVLFEVWTIFITIQQKKRMKIRQKLTKLNIKYAFSKIN